MDINWHLHYKQIRAQQKVPAKAIHMSITKTWVTARMTAVEDDRSDVSRRRPAANHDVF